MEFERSEEEEEEDFLRKAKKKKEIIREKLAKREQESREEKKRDFLRQTGRRRLTSWKEFGAEHSNLSSSSSSRHISIAIKLPFVPCFAFASLRSPHLALGSD